MADPIVNVTTRTYNIQVTKKENKVVVSSPGPQGAVGVGFPIGGTTGQFLTKIDGTNYNTQWITLPSYQPLDSDLTQIAALTSNGLLRKTSGSWTMDQTTYLVSSDLSPYLTISSAASTYLTISNAASIYQPIGNYLTSYTETDPVFLSSPAYTITSQQITNWNSGASFPSQSGNNGKFLTTNGSTTSWATVDALPSQSGNNGKYLTTNGSSASWGTLDLSLYLTTANATSTYLTQSNASSTYLTQSNASSTYLTQTNATSTYQPKDQDLTDIAALTGNGVIRKTSGVWGMDSSVYLTSYTEIDTLSSVTGRGASTSSAISITNTTQSTSYSTGSLVVGGGVGIAKDLFVQGNLVLTGNIDINGTITGNLTQINVADLNVTDSLIYLGSENLTSDTLDIGFNGAYRPLGDVSGHKHSGFARDHNDSGIWKLFSGAAEITGNDIDFGLSDANVNFDQLKIRSLIVTDASTTRTNLGLGTMAVETATNYLTTSSASSTYAPLSNPVFLTAIGFEGTTVNDNETYLTVVDPTADRTITLPDDTGTVALTKNTANLGTANFFTVGGHTIASQDISTVGLTIKPFASGTSTQIWQNATPSTVSSVGANGAFAISTFGGTFGSQYGLSVGSVSGATGIPVAIRGSSGQIGDLLQLQNTSNVILAGFGAAGELYSGITGSTGASASPTTIPFATPVAISTTSQSSSTTVTYNTTYNHGLVTGQYVTITGVTSAPTTLVHNISGMVNSVTSSTQFTMIAAATGSNTGTGGTITGTRTQAFIQATSTYSAALKLKAASSKSVTVTAASGNGTTVTYTAAQSGYNALIAGDSVTITGLGITTGSSLNLSSQIVVTSSATQFTVTNTTVGTAVATQAGTATVNAYAAPFLLENGAGTIVFRVDPDGSSRAAAFANVNSYANANLTPQTTGWLLGASTSASTSIPLKIQNANAGTITGDLTQWLNNSASPVVLAKVDASGNITSTGIITTGANSGTQGQLKINGSTSGTAIITTPAAAGTPTITLPITTGTLLLNDFSNTATNSYLSTTAGATAVTTLEIGSGSTSINSTHNYSSGTVIGGTTLNTSLGSGTSSSSGISAQNINIGTGNFSSGTAITSSKTIQLGGGTSATSPAIQTINIGTSGLKYVNTIGTAFANQYNRIVIGANDRSSLTYLQGRVLIGAVPSVYLNGSTATSVGAGTISQTGYSIFVPGVGASVSVGDIVYLSGTSNANLNGLIGRVASIVSSDANIDVSFTQTATGTGGNLFWVPANFIVSSPSTYVPAQVIRATSFQDATPTSIFQIENSSGTVLSSFSSTGALTLPNTGLTVGSTAFTGTTGSGLLVGATSPTISTQIITPSSGTFTAFAQSATLSIGGSTTATITIGATTVSGTHSYSSGTTGTTLAKIVNLGAGAITGTTASNTINIGTGTNSATSGLININIGTGAMTAGAYSTVTIGSSVTSKTLLNNNIINASQTALTASATITGANILTKNIYLNAATTAVTFTLDTGANMDTLATGLNNPAVGSTIEWTIINDGTSLAQITVSPAATGHTFSGTNTVAINTAANFITRKTATNSYVTYRLT